MRKRNQCKFNHHYFDKIDSPEKSYWLGFLMADGTISDRAKKGALQLQIHLANKDIEHLKKFHLAIESDNAIHYEADGSIRSSHSSDYLCEALINLGCTSRKTFTLEFPKLPDELINHFIRGYFDGDGSACIHKGRLFIHFLGTYNFIETL